MDTPDVSTPEPSPQSPPKKAFGENLREKRDKDQRQFQDDQRPTRDQVIRSEARKSFLG